MADKNQTATQPPIRIGYYILGETLGVGSFGKVKSKYIVGIYIYISFLSIDFLI